MVCARAPRFSHASPPSLSPISPSCTPPSWYPAAAAASRTPCAAPRSTGWTSCRTRPPCSRATTRLAWRGWARAAGTGAGNWGTGGTPAAKERERQCVLFSALKTAASDPPLQSGWWCHTTNRSASPHQPRPSVYKQKKKLLRTRSTSHHNNPLDAKNASTRAPNAGPTATPSSSLPTAIPGCRALVSANKACTPANTSRASGQPGSVVSAILTPLGASRQCSAYASVARRCQEAPAPMRRGAPRAGLSGLWGWCGGVGFDRRSCCASPSLLAAPHSLCRVHRRRQRPQRKQQPKHGLAVVVHGARARGDGARAAPVCGEEGAAGPVEDVEGEGAWTGRRSAGGVRGAGQEVGQHPSRRSPWCEVPNADEKKKKTQTAGKFFSFLFFSAFPRAPGAFLTPARASTRHQLVPWSSLPEAPPRRAPSLFNAVRGDTYQPNACAPRPAPPSTPPARPPASTAGLGRAACTSWSGALGSCGCCCATNRQRGHATSRHAVVAPTR